MGWPQGSCDSVLIWLYARKDYTPALQLYRAYPYPNPAPVSCTLYPAPCTPDAVDCQHHQPAVVISKFRLTQSLLRLSKGVLHVFVN